MTKLKGKQALFVAEYLKDQNGTRAAIAAGYSEHTAAVMAHENLRKPNIMEAIALKTEKVMQKHEITQDKILSALAEMGFGTVKKNGLLKHEHRLKALEMLCKHLGLLDGTGVDKGNSGVKFQRLNGAIARIKARNNAGGSSGDQ